MLTANPSANSLGLFDQCPPPASSTWSPLPRLINSVASYLAPGMDPAIPISSKFVFCGLIRSTDVAHPLNFSSVTMSCSQHPDQDTGHCRHPAPSLAPLPTHYTQRHLLTQLLHHRFVLSAFELYLGKTIAALVQLASLAQDYIVRLTHIVANGSHSFKFVAV